jgi:hypothetical protein
LDKQPDQRSESDQSKEAPDPQNPTIPISPMSQQQEPIRHDQGNNRTADISSVQSVRRELHWLEILNFVGQIILAIVGIVAVSIYGRQLGVMKDQLNQIKGSGEQTDRLLRLYDQQLAQMQSQTQAQVDSAKAAQDSVKAAHGQLSAALEASYQDQRPWVGVELTSIEGKPKEQQIIVRNTGKTPALHWVLDCWEPKMLAGVRLEDRPTCYQLRTQNREEGIQNCVPMYRQFNYDEARRKCEGEIDESMRMIAGVRGTGRTIVPGQSFTWENIITQPIMGVTLPSECIALRSVGFGD